jgi:hypothetical protein
VSLTNPSRQTEMRSNAHVDKSFPVTPDGRYFVVRGRLWRCSRPDLSELERAALVEKLMRARHRLGTLGNVEQHHQARLDVDSAKRELGERGPVWWADGAPDFNRHLVKNTPYAEWFDSLAA